MTMPMDEATLAHQEWLGYLQPVGLVVSPYALHQAQALVDRNLIEPHTAFLQALAQWQFEDQEDPESAIIGWRHFAQEVLGWESTDLLGEGGGVYPEELSVPLADHGEILKPTYVVPDPSPLKDGSPWLMLIQEIRPGTDLDKLPHEGDGWLASPMARFERLLRETKVPTGLLINGRSVRLVHAPRGETSGYMDFKVAEMEKVSGRLIFGAFRMLLGAERMFVLPDKQRLPAILADSRRYQALVSTQLAQQVLGALYELLRGFQSADEAAKGQLLKEVLEKDPSKVYAGLLTVLLRMVFLLFAEDRGKEAISDHEVYLKHYSVLGLYDQLREDASRYPDTMDLRYGAWARLLSLFRLIYDGANHGGLHLPARHGHLFEPDRFLFLEGRTEGTTHRDAGRLVVPLVSDGVIYRVLTSLLLLDGERLSYRTLDVEQIGSVYESMMGFTLELAEGPTLAIRSKEPHGAPVAINLEALLRVAAGEREKWLKKATDQKLTGQVLESFKRATTVEGLAAALDGKVNRDATPGIVPKGAMVLQPSPERRRSGSHYTPRSLTGPIVRKALQPILQLLGPNPTPVQILALKVLDPAVGSAAFLVEACRQLAEALVAAWRAHNCVPKIPLDEDELLHARRLVAQRCLYGVDRNPMAVDLAKLSLWLVTLAKDHPFTFLDHAIRCGDSLVGIWLKEYTTLFFGESGSGGAAQQVKDAISKSIERGRQARQIILDAGEDTPESLLNAQMEAIDKATNRLRILGDVLIHCFFTGRNAKERAIKRSNARATVHQWLTGANDGEGPKALATSLRHIKPAINPFHWELEFPEVFYGENPGFDTVIGNPPFAGRSTLFEGNHPYYIDYLCECHTHSHGNSDLVAHFFRRAFSLIKNGGTFGLIATNTISQGDTRYTGLEWIAENDGIIFDAITQYKWPGSASVTVNIICIIKNLKPLSILLNYKQVNSISSFLFKGNVNSSPNSLQGSKYLAFQGCVVAGNGFIFDNNDTKGVTSSIDLMKSIISKNPLSTDRIFPYISGEEVNDSPIHQSNRYIINLGDRTIEECESKWPELVEVVKKNVKEAREALNSEVSSGKRKRAEKWWQFGSLAKELYMRISHLDQVLVCSAISKHHLFAFCHADSVFSHNVIVFTNNTMNFACIIQSQIHTSFAQFFSSTLEDRLGYRPSDCLDTFPFPSSFEEISDLEVTGKAYFDHRASLMARNQQGLTATYNRFHDPEERDKGILLLRSLHGAMDQAVLRAYGWLDLELSYDFFPDFEPVEDEYGEPTRVRIRYRWPNELREEVLARLLALNAQRAEEERLQVTFTEVEPPENLKPPKGRGRKPKAPVPMAAETPLPYLSGMGEQP